LRQNFLLYGANGYTGRLVAGLAAGRGLRPLLAGRDARALDALGAELGLDTRVFSLDDTEALDAALAEVGAVLHCAGPFSHTSRPVADACLRTGAHYLDITGEIAVFESLAARDAEARAGGVTLLPGVGFDVVPSDCLAAHLKRRLPTATRLTLAIKGTGRISHGTATTMAENIHRGGMVRRGGRLTPVPAAWRTRLVDYGQGPESATTIPWGDVATAFHSTGIPDVEVYAALPASARLAMKLTRALGSFLASAPAQRLFKSRIKAQPAGPSEEERARGRSYVWGEATDDAGGRASARLTAPEGYALTAMTALASVERVLGGDAPAGFQTPSKAFGPDFILEFEGVERVDLD
jgi:short subunit dehydrogenase-like uncharacterized protein